jgi:hypothetical protein
VSSLDRLEVTAALPTGLPGAECAFDPELHTGPRDAIESPQERAAREDVAKEVCAGCPARTVCEAYALRNRPKRGVWAGRTAAELAALASFELGEVA